MPGQGTDAPTTATRHTLRSSPRVSGNPLCPPSCSTAFRESLPLIDSFEASALADMEPSSGEIIWSTLFLSDVANAILGMNSDSTT